MSFPSFFVFCSCFISLLADMLNRSFPASAHFQEIISHHIHKSTRARSQLEKTENKRSRISSLGNSEQKKKKINHIRRSLRPGQGNIRRLYRTGTLQVLLETFAWQHQVIPADRVFIKTKTEKMFRLVLSAGRNQSSCELHDVKTGLSSNNQRAK